MKEVLDIVDALKTQGPLFLVLVAMLFGSYKGVWVWGYQLKEAKEEGERWKSTALQVLGLAETATGIAKRVNQP